LSGKIPAGGRPPAAAHCAFTGEQLREIAFPLGGIGTGTVSLGGRGQLCDWEVFNRPGKGRDLPYTFFAVWVRQGSRPPVARVLERRLLPPFRGSSGLPTARVSGLPRLEEAVFTGHYPSAQVRFQDARLPVEVTLGAFNPMIPLDADDSGLPVAVFRWTLRNGSNESVDAAVAFSLFNAAGYDGQSVLTNRRHPLFGNNLNEFVVVDGARGIRMTTGRYAADHPQFGSLAILTPCQEVTFSERWERAGWWDDLQSFWDDFSADGRLPDRAAPEPSPDGQTDVGTLGARAMVPPGESVVLPFVLAWHFPNLVNYWNREECCRGQLLGNYYAARFADAWDAGLYALQHLDRLESDSTAFQEALYGSTLPPAVLDAAGSQMSIVRTTTCLRTRDGGFHAFEGCHDNAGCCPMNCTHVWNYAVAVAHLFPELERSMRQTDFGVNTRPDGRMAFRTLLPLSSEALWGGPPAADGQLGCILKLYREWTLSGDDEFLESLWPNAWSALKYCWERWDPDRDGVMEGEQHNTYDIEFYGPNTMVGTLYLAALKAAAEMATAAGARKVARECERLFESGSRRLDQELWNGEYFSQKIVPPARPAEGLGPGTQSLQLSGEVRYQYGEGCLSDQLLGEWFARVAGLERLLPENHVRSALAAIVRHNFRAELAGHASCQRTYALNDEAGLLLCSWPRGGRPAYPFPYADEVWTGIEYQVAAHCIYEGLVEEGLRIVEAVRDRHDGARRNPWDEVECGHHYARAMSSWSLLLALSGCSYSARDASLAFAPRVSQDNFRCFFAAGTAWGLFRQVCDAAAYQATLEPAWGELDLRSLRLPLDGRQTVSVTQDGTPVDARFAGDAVTFAAPVTLRAGQILLVAADGRAPEAPGARG
jgi:non-lysosomal glucosylceramidase